ncbi:MAG: cyclase family protein [Clostridiales bacterium]|nr:cyclase family protein [Clostridiales bacterium]
MKVDFSKVVELSHDMLPGKEPFKLEVDLFDVDDLGERGEEHSEGVWYVAADIEMSTHCGTHIEFPLHHWEGGDDAKDYPLENMIGQACVLDFTGKKAHEGITIDELKAKAEEIKEGDIVFIRTDFDKKWRTKDWEPFPYIECDALEWLLDTKKPKAIGSDATSIENLKVKDQPNHTACFSRGVAIIESLTNLSKIENNRALVFILPMKIKGIDSCPVRIVAINNGGII